MSETIYIFPPDFREILIQEFTRLVRRKDLVNERGVLLWILRKLKRSKTKVKKRALLLAAKTAPKRRRKKKNANRKPERMRRKAPIQDEEVRKPRVHRRSSPLRRKA